MNVLNFAEDFRRSADRAGVFAGETFHTLSPAVRMIRSLAVSAILRRLVEEIVGGLFDTLLAEKKEPRPALHLVPRLT